MRNSVRVSIPLLLAATLPAAAQTSPSYTLAEHTFNAASHPSGGTVLVSTGGAIGFRIRLDALGDSIVGSTMSSAGDTFRMDGGFLVAYSPPSEVKNLKFSSNKVTLTWDPEKSAGTYSLYRGLLSTLSGLAYGQCQQSTIPTNSTSDGVIPSASTGYFYLITARNRLREEGTKGYNSAGVERPNTAPCP